MNFLLATALRGTGIKLRRSAAARHTAQLFALVAAIALPVRSGASDLVWVTPEDARAMMWSETAPTRVVDPGRFTALLPNEFLLVPVEPGQKLRVFGTFERLGLGSGTEEVPDVVRWVSSNGGSLPGKRELTVPPWENARFVVVGGKDREAVVRVELAEPLSHGLLAHRFNADVIDWIRSNRATPPEAKTADLARALRVISALSHLAPTDASTSFLLEIWREEFLKLVPLREPYFVRRKRSIEAAQAVPFEDPENIWQRISRGTHIAKDAQSDAVLRIGLRGRGLGKTVVRIYSGTALKRTVTFDVPPRSASAERWTAATWFRLVDVDEAPVRAEVAEGEAAISISGYSQRPDLFAQLAGGFGPANKPTSPARDAWAGIRTSRNSAELETRLSEAIEALSRFPINGSDKFSLARNLLERALPASEDQPILGPRAFELLKVEAPETEDREVVLAWLHALRNDAREKRPRAAPDFERWARTHGRLSGNVRTLRSMWQSEAPWASLSPSATALLFTEVTQPQELLLGQTQCSTLGPLGQRWTLLSGSESIRVAAPPNDVLLPQGAAPLARAIARPADANVVPEFSMRVDEASVPVHAAAGISSLFAIAPGKHIFEVPPNRNVLLRVPRNETVACSKLRDVAEWADAAHSITYNIGGYGTTLSRAAFRFPTSKGNRLATILIRSDNVRTEAWARSPATGTLEMPIPASATSLEITSTSPLWVRSWAKVNESPKPLRIVGADAYQADSDATIDELRAVSAELAQGPLEKRNAARRRRRELLELLGFASFAEFERARLDGSPTESAFNSDFVAVPSAAISVLPLGISSRIVPLGVPKNDAALKRARVFLASGDERQVHDVLKDSVQSSSQADSLLFAQAAEAFGDTRKAADAFARIGTNSGSGAALGKAASLYADVAASERDLRLTLNAYAVSQRALELGDPEGRALPRLAPSISWRAPSRSESPVGQIIVDAPPSNVRRMPLGERVRRAMLNAPADAVVIQTGELLNVRFDRGPNRTIAIDALCEDFASDACAFAVDVDGKRSACTLNQSTHACEFDIDTNEHRVELALADSSRAVGWIRIRDRTLGATLKPAVKSAFWEIDNAHPAEFPLAGPTVVRLRSRGEQQVPSTIRYTFTSREGNVISGILEVSGQPDPEATVRGSRPLAPTLETEQRFAIAEETQGTLRIIAEKRSLVRFEVATAHAPALPRYEVPARSGPQSLEGATSSHSEASPTPSEVAPGDIVRSKARVLPFTIGAGISFSSADITEDDERRSRNRMELSARVLRELYPERVWFSANSFTRVRSGAESYGTELQVESQPADLLPGAIARGRLVTQAATPVALGALGSAALHWSVPLAPSWSLAPSLEIGASHVDSSVEGQDDTDPDVFSPYKFTHPTHASFELEARTRPLLDVLLQFGARGRAAPLPDDLDRVEAEAQADLLPGRGLFPWITMNWVGSYRLSSELRRDAYLRNSFATRVQAFHWTSIGSRLLFGIEGSASIDTPSVYKDAAQFALMFFATFDYASGRGVRDFPLRLTPFRDRLEEGSDVEKTGRTGVWETPSLPPELLPL